ncbi:LysR family transcriptional regulator [Bosea sp. 2YAB26]|uniref:LysR family transcriptional regulator n=1 Tax=Bosea sp. 2YAB26 TaxID=3237478 RepID=UPI003F919ECC
MDVRSLAYFVAVYEEQSFSLAARRCTVSQPSISAAIRQLEEHLECQLFIRNARGVSPTSASDQIFQTAVRLIAEFGSLKAMLRRPVATKPVRCAVMPGLSGERVSGFLKEAAIASPELYFELQSEGSASEIMIVSEAALSEDEVFHPLWRDSYRAVVPVGHPLTMREEVTMAALAEEPIVVANWTDAPGSPHRAFQDKGIALARMSVAHSHQDALAIAGAGFGVAIVPSSEPIRLGLAAREIDDMKVERNVGLSCARSYLLPSGLSIAVNICRLRWQSR